MGLLVPYVPSPLYVVRKMLELAGVGQDDIVYDLGCGDGRIVITAVKEFDAKKGVCIELREELVQRVLKKVKEEGLENRVEVRKEDMFKADIGEATVVTLFLLTSVNDQLAPKLENELRPGTRVVSHEFRITDWKPLVTAIVNDGRLTHNIYLYVIGNHRRVAFKPLNTKELG